MSENIRIFIVDDHDEVRQSLRELLIQEEDMEIVGEGAIGKDAIINSAVYSPDIILSDVKMPIVNGAESTDILMESSISCKVILLTRYEVYLDEDEKIGVRCHHLERIDIHDFSEIIKGIYQGEIVIDGRVGSKGKTELVPV